MLSHQFDLFLSQFKQILLFVKLYYQSSLFLLFLCVEVQEVYPLQVDRCIRITQTKDVFSNGLFHNPAHTWIRRIEIFAHFKNNVVIFFEGHIALAYNFIFMVRSFVEECWVTTFWHWFFYQHFVLFFWFYFWNYFGFLILVVSYLIFVNFITVVESMPMQNVYQIDVTSLDDM